MSQTPQYSCPVCSIAFKSRSGLWKHRKRCFPPSPFSPDLTTPIPGVPLTPNIIKSERGARGVPGRESTRGKPLGGGNASWRRNFPPVITWWINCPSCGERRVEWAYMGQEPMYLTCEYCERVIPFPAWRVALYTSAEGSLNGSTASPDSQNPGA